MFWNKKNTLIRVSSSFFVLVITPFLSIPLLALAQSSVDGRCECTIVDSNSAFVAAPSFAQSECMGSPGSGFANCQWATGGSSQCLCQKNFNQTFPNIAAIGACSDTSETIKNQLGANQQILGCVWIGEDPAAEQGQLFSAPLRTDIRGLDKFGGKSLPQVIGTIIKTAMGVMGSLALVIFIYGGINWMLARGDESMQKKGFDTILWGSIGIAVMLASYALVNYVFEAFR